MKHKWLCALSVVLSILSAPFCASAHHAFQAEFDQTKQFQLTGVLTKVDWINPHIYFFLDVKDASGKVTNWALTTAGPGMYHRAGLNRDFVKVGDTYTVTVCAAKDKSTDRAYVRSWKYPDGHVVDVWFIDPSELQAK